MSKETFRLSGKVEFHEMSSMYALRDDWTPLSDDLKRREREGKEPLLEPIVLASRSDKKIIDGRRRYLACRRANVEPIYRYFGSRDTDGDSMVEFVFRNYFHRDQSAAERARAAAMYATWKKGENQHSSQGKEGGPKGPPSPVSVKDAAKKFGTNESQVKKVKKVEKKGTPKVNKAMADEKVAISDAASIVNEPAEVQDAAVDMVLEDKAPNLKAAVKTIHADPQEDLDEISKETLKLADRLNGLMVKRADRQAKCVRLFKDLAGLVVKLNA